MVAKRGALLEEIVDILQQPSNVYQMPDGTWAFANGGKIADGFASEGEARATALEAIVEAAIMMKEEHCGN